MFHQWGICRKTFLWCESLWVCVWGTCVTLRCCSTLSGLALLAAWTRVVKSPWMGGNQKFWGFACRLLTWCKIVFFSTWSGKCVLIWSCHYYIPVCKLMHVESPACGFVGLLLFGAMILGGGGITAATLHFYGLTYFAAECVRVLSLVFWVFFGQVNKMKE